MVGEGGINVSWPEWSVLSLWSWYVYQVVHTQCTNSWMRRSALISVAWKKVLYTVFTLDPFTVWKQFVVCHLWPGLMSFWLNCTDLHFCSVGMSEDLKYVFVARLPAHADQLIQVSSQMENLDLPQVLAQARAIMKNFTDCVEHVAVAAQSPCCTPRGIHTQTSCYAFDGPNHRVCDCLLRYETSRRVYVKLQRTITCYWCQWQGHIASDCLGNRQEGKNLVPVSSSKHM